MKEGGEDDRGKGKEREKEKGEEGRKMERETEREGVKVKSSKESAKGNARMNFSSTLDRFTFCVAFLNPLSSVSPTVPFRL